MLQFILRRLVMMVPTLFAISIVTFIIIQLPPGDFFTTYMQNMASQGETVDQSQAAAFQKQFGYGEPVYVQYGKWIWNIITKGDFGRSFSRGQPVTDLIGERMWLTIALSLFALLITWAIAFPIGCSRSTQPFESRAAMTHRGSPE